MNNNLIINKPKLKSSLMRTLETIFSVSFWAAFLYFFQPLVTAVFWMFTGKWIFSQIFSYSMMQSMAEMLLNCLIFSVFVGIIMIAWSCWNSWCYAGLDRRKPRPLVPDSTVAALYNIPEETIITARKARLALVTPTASGVVFTIIKEV